MFAAATLRPGSQIRSLRSLLSFFSDDLAIDLGTANTLVYARDKGIVVDEPSYIAVNKVDGTIVAVGQAAKRMVGRTPLNVNVIQPLKDGVIADFDSTETMLKHFIRKARNRKPLLSSRIVICVPSRTTQVERRAVRDAGLRLGANSVFVVEEPLAAALGAGLPVTEPRGSMIIDIGGGTTEIAVISLSGIVCSSSVRVAGNHMDEAIMQDVRRKHNLLIGECTAEKIKLQLGSALPLNGVEEMEVRGRGLLEGIPRHIFLKSDEVLEALSDSVSAIINAVRLALEVAPPELSGDIVEGGIYLTGGAALLQRLDERLSRETGVPVHLAQNPLSAVVLGTAKMLTDTPFLKRISL